MSSHVASQINYKAESQSALPKYRYLRVPLNNLTGTAFTITGSTSQLIEFKLPTTVYNLAQSFLSYQISLPAQSAIATWTHEDCLELATNAYFGTAGGLDLCNLNYVNRYTKVVRKMRTKVQDYLANDNTSGLYPSNANGSANYTATTGGPAPTVTTFNNFLEPTYLGTGAIGVAPGLNQIRTASRFYPLNGIVDTVFSLDKDLYIPTDMYVRFTVGVGNQIAFQSSSVTDPSASAAAIAGNITIQNLYLYLAVEQNQLIVDSVVNKVMTSGLRLNLPYTTAFRNSSSGTIANIQIPLTQQYGKKFKRMIHTVWNATESANTAMDCNNHNGAKIETYNTYLDQRQLQDFPLSSLAPTVTAINSDDWRENQKYCRDSVILNRAVYALNWFHCDQFYEDSTVPTALADNLDNGLTMDSVKLWAIQAVTKNLNLVHYDFATFVRSVEINQAGVQFVV